MALNSKAGQLVNNTSKFTPSFNPSNIGGGVRDYSSSLINGASKFSNIPKSTTFQPTGYRPSFNSSERKNANTGSEFSSYQPPQITPSHLSSSPYSRYNENKTLQNTPSASSIHSMNISGLSGVKSVQSSYQVQYIDSTETLKRDSEFDITKLNKENKSPNNLTSMSLIHTTKPAPSKITSEYEQTSNENMFKRNVPSKDNNSDESDESDDDNDKSHEGIIPIKYFQETQ